MKKFGFASATLVLLTGCGANDSQPARQTPHLRPKLILFLSVDQARYDYFTRFRPLFKRGFKDLLERGVHFTNAHHNHAITVTAPGHASLLTGLYPKHSGIIANDWYDREKKEPVYCVGDPAYPLIGSNLSSEPSGRSPKHLLGNTLSDWIKKATPKSKAFTASGKDRSAILMGGKEADAAFWYDKQTGQYVTSQYYWKEYPPWMEKFHQRGIPDAHFGKTWEPLPVSTLDSASLAAIERFPDCPEGTGFPHSLGGLSLFPDSSFYSAFYSSPFLDGYLVQFAQALIENESLGVDDDPDFLGLSFSAVDSIGHAHGPNSPEILDAFLRLDEALGELLDFLDGRIGLANIAISLSADHGVMTLPEYLRHKKLQGGRMGVQDVICFQSSGHKFETKFGEEEWFLEGFYLNHEVLDRRNLSRQKVEAELARLVKECPIVAKVWTRTQLESPSPHPDPYLQLFRNNFHRQRSPDLFVQLKKFYLGSAGSGTSHGSVYDYDTHVPLVLLFPGIPAATVEKRVNTVDLAPTLVSLLKLPMPEKLDGMDRSSWLRAH